MRAVYALYPDGASAQRAVDGLRAAGVADAEITVISACPMEDFEFSHIGGKNRLWYVACAGGLVGFLASTWLTTFTEGNWPINTGGMPIVAWWPNLIIMFEMTMLGGIVATVGTLHRDERPPPADARALRSGSERRQDPRRRGKSLPKSRPLLSSAPSRFPPTSSSRPFSQHVASGSTWRPALAGPTDRIGGTLQAPGECLVV